MLTQEKLKEMEEEMDRFEQEILAPSDNEPRMIIGANTYTKVQAQLKMASHPEDYPANSAPPGVTNEAQMPTSVSNMEIPLSVLSAPPPPPPPPSGQRPLDNQFTRLPPPPPPPQPPPMARPAPAFLPHQLRHRPPMPLRHPMHMGPRPSSNAAGMSHFQAPPPPPPMMGGSGPGAPPPHHMPGPMMMPPQRPFMAGPAGAMYNPGQQAQQESMMTPNINIEKPKVIYSAPPTCKNQKIEPTRMSDSHVVTIAGQSSSASVTSTASATSVPSNVSQYQSNEQTHTVTSEGGTEEEIMGVDASNDPDSSGQQKKEKKEKKRRYVRTAAGQIWEDHTLSEWITDDFRIFCGDLGNEVTDEVLTRAFSKFPSFVKAKVVRDKRSNKTKGYGFVSFRDPNDFVRAMREMNGKYVGNRPIKLRKSSWKERNIEIVRKKDKEKKRLGLR